MRHFERLGQKIRFDAYSDEIKSDMILALLKDYSPQTYDGFIKTFPQLVQAEIKLDHSIIEEKKRKLQNMYIGKR